MIHIKILLISALGVIIVSIIYLTGRPNEPAQIEKRRTHALIDSVNAIPDVVHHAAESLEKATRAMIEGDSLLHRGQGPAARVSYAEALVYARLSVVETEFESVRTPTPANRDST